MNHLDNLETSYNRQAQKRIFEQLDIIDNAKIEYLEKKYQYKKEYLEQTKTLISDLKREEVLLKGYRKDYKNELKKLKNEFELKKAELQDNRKYNLNETKQHLSLVMAKIDANYKKVKKEFQQALASNSEGAEAKFQAFESQFPEYRQKEYEKRLKEKNQEIENINKAYSARLMELTETYTNKLKLLKEKHNKENYLKFKQEKLANIKTFKNEINQIKADLSAEEKENHGNGKLKSAYKEYLEIKKEAKIAIKTIKTEVNSKVSKMTKAEKTEYMALQKYIKQDYRVRKLKIIDEKEKRLLKNVNPAYIYITPAIFGAVFFTLVPFIFMIIGSLFRVNFANIGESKWMGINNFVTIFTKDIEFQKSLINTAIFALLTIVFLTVVTVSMAAWLSKNTRIHNLAQTMVFTPHIASLVSISILWIAMLNPTGIINQGLSLFGIKGPAWLLQENTSLFSVSLVTVWKDIGYYVLIIIAGLQGIPTYVYEAAKLDKASKATTFFKITIPLLTPTLSFVFLAKFINAFKVFAPIEIMTNGGPMGSSMVLSYWIYKVGRIGFNYGLAMAGAIVLTVMIALVTVIKNYYFNKVTKY